ncbi:MAG: hypothetical protein WAW11_02770 [Patescibacteria group bacterium]
MSKNTEFIDQIAPVQLEIFLGRIMHQLGESDPVKVVHMVNAGVVYLSNIKQGWITNDDVITFPVISDKTSGPQWLKRLKNKGIYVDDIAKEMLLSKAFKPTDEIATIVVIFRVPYAMFGDNASPLPIAEAKGLIEAVNGMELACLIRDKFTNKQLSLMGCSQLVISVGEYYFYVTGGENKLAGLGAFKKRLDSDFSYVFQEK